MRVISAAMSIRLLHTFGALLRAAVSLCLVHFVLSHRRSHRVRPLLSMLCALLLISAGIRVAGQTYAWLGIGKPVILYLSMLVSNFTLIVWMPVVLLDFLRVKPLARNVAILSAFFASVSFLVATVAGEPRIMLTLVICSCCISAVLLKLVGRRISPQALRRSGIFIFVNIECLGLLSIAVSLLVRALLKQPLIASYSASLVFEVAIAMLVLGTLFAFVQLHSADRLLTRVMRIYLWMGFTYASGFSVLFLNAWAAHNASSRQQAAAGLVSFGVIGTAALFSSMISNHIPDFVETRVFGWTDPDAKESAFAKALKEATSTHDVLACAHARFKQELNVDVAFLDMESGQCIVPLASEQRKASTRSSPQPLRVSAVKHFEISNTTQRRRLLKVEVDDLRPTLLKCEERYIERIAVLLGSRMNDIAAESERLHRIHADSEIKAALVESELQALRSQVDPHFLFNALSSVAELAIERPKEAETMVLRLAETFRYVLTHAKQHVVSLSLELQFAESYIAIQKARFGERLHYSVDIAPGLRECLVPTLLLQPVLENAIKFGIGRSRSGGSICVRCISCRAGVCLSIVNTVHDSPVAAQREVPSFSLGLSNVLRRIQLICGPEASLTLTKLPTEGAVVEVYIPVR